MLEIKKLENNRKVAFMREYGSNCGMYIRTTLHKEFESMPLSRSRSILYGQCTCGIFGDWLWPDGNMAEIFVLDNGHRWT